MFNVLFYVVMLFTIGWEGSDCLPEVPLENHGVEESEEKSIKKKLSKKEIAVRIFGIIFLCIGAWWITGYFVQKLLTVEEEAHAKDLEEIRAKADKFLQKVEDLIYYLSQDSDEDG